MGDVTCEMLDKEFKAKTGSEIVDKPREFGGFLTSEVIKASGRYRYNDLFKRISGNNFSLSYRVD
ncbi:hypothetical protein [Alkaliphilus serpentinus]|uniref:Uncharacterized protein n=1 Tax=Alkaliphilus serpentinus TaxID=1482731 RepID=A0A833HN22_9FIRM|nr:hypothetical protein [Alkaliphilus serpentinus]KAB3528957.1 hypothetical protein F8153_10680 [Alkaliphilus serpentinus]